MGYLASQEEVNFDILKQAITCGSAMDSFCVEKFGTQALREIEPEVLYERIDRFAHLVHFDVPGWEKGQRKV